MLGMTHQPPEATRGLGEGGGRETKLFDSDYCVLSRGMLALEVLHSSCLGPSLTTKLSLVMKGSPDTHRIPSDKLRPMGNKIAVVDTEHDRLQRNKCLDC